MLCNNYKNYNPFAKFCKFKAVKMVWIDSENVIESVSFFVGTINTEDSDGNDQI